ncbi:MAG: C4-dicarboxylate transporter DcuC [Dehalobacterium sp.]
MELIMTLVMFALLIWGLKKKIVLPTLMLGISLIGLAYLTIIHGSLLGDKTSGNAIVDIFEYIAQFLTSTVGGIVLIIMVVIAYLEVMNKIKASEMLAVLISGLLKGIRKPYLLAALVIAVGALFRIAITSAPPAAALLIATLFPVLIKSRCSVPTAAFAMIACGVFTWGPADSTNLTALSLMGLQNTNMTNWFVQMQVPLILTYLLIMAVTFVITAKIFDKSEKAATNAEYGESLSAADLNVPKIYAILPFLPVILLFVFSPLAIKSIKFSIMGAILVSLLVTLVVHLIGKKNAGSIAEVMGAFYSGLGDTFKGLGVLIIFAMLFASVLNQIGGMKIIAETLGGLSVPPLVLVLFIVAFTALMTMIVGSFFGALSVMAPLALNIATTAGINPLFVCFMVVTACGAGGLCSPVNPTVVLVSDRCKIDILHLIKRTAIPVWIGLIGTTLIGFVMFG